MTLLLRHNGQGQLAELDVAALGGRGLAVVDFGSGGKSIASVSVSAPAVTAQSVALVAVAAVATPDHSADEHLIEEIEARASACTPGVGFTIWARTGNIKLFGRYSVAWVWG